MTIITHNTNQAVGLAAMLMLTACQSTDKQTQTDSITITQEQRSPANIIAQAGKDDWRLVAADNMLKITLPTGPVYVELNPLLAPGHVDNIKALAREGFYQGLNMYRFVEGFVAQGGDQDDKKQPVDGKKSIAAEFFYTTSEALTITELGLDDGYAPRTGFLNGFAVAQSEDGKRTWQTHCPGTFAMARQNSADSGGSEFYFTLTAQRYLDLNTTVFGRVLAGMEHVQRLHRTPTAGQAFNPIVAVEVLTDTQDKQRFMVFNTQSEAFLALIAARQNRPEAWFLHQANHTDVCAITVPVKAFIDD
ncbi:MULTISPECIES: peptidylprolyl isomerase [unclassified Pseudoalteromonas]|uniref:peptidylprolyl isomerase n=1 Tax=unclassified Pseudoalteromonas TaxID=194690 RepID=UPI002097D627|nr:peptidylprolyl isomerase [Pseudoalteromonas sp. XMcav2-N]MCO7189666.1 peptidylprolyl isomerase [Pseudoalteromonas sp. XMcav2-N]